MAWTVSDFPSNLQSHLELPHPILSVACIRVLLVRWNVLSNPLLDGFFEDVSIPAYFSLQGHFLFLL